MCRKDKTKKEPESKQEQQPQKPANSQSFSDFNLSSPKICIGNSLYSIDLNKNQLKSEENEESDLSIENTIRL